MQYCNGQLKGTVILKYPTLGQMEFFSEHPPINVEVESNGVEPGIIRLNYEYQINNGDWFPISNLFFKPPDWTPEWTPAWTTLENVDICGNPSNRWRWANVLTNGAGAVGCGEPNPAPNYNNLNNTNIGDIPPAVRNFQVIGPECHVLITDAERIIWDDIKPECPEVEAFCEDCPPNHLKCKSDKWPGYCCIPCGEVAAEIRGINNRLRSIR